VKSAIEALTTRVLFPVTSSLIYYNSDAEFRIVLSETPEFYEYKALNNILSELSLLKE